jgi:hypothetical protein
MLDGVYTMNKSVESFFATGSYRMRETGICDRENLRHFAFNAWLKG